MTQANKDQTWSNPAQVTQTTTPQTTTTQTTTPQTTTPASPAPATASPSPGVPAPASPTATQAITSAVQAAQANPGLASSVAATAPGLVAATAEAFRVDTPTAAMMVLQGMRNQEAAKTTQVAGLGEAAPSQSPVGYSDLGGDGSQPASSAFVDQAVAGVLGGGGENMFSRGAVPGFAHGGLVQTNGYARGGLTKGSNLAAINMPAVRAPGAHLINSAVPGRTDRIPMRARTGSFVIPADVVSGLGEGNTMAGAKMWGEMLTHVAGGAAMKRPTAVPRSRSDTASWGDCADTSALDTEGAAVSCSEDTVRGSTSEFTGAAAWVPGWR